MFLVIILFGLLALSLAFVTYWQADIQRANHPNPDPPSAVAGKSVTPKAADADATLPATAAPSDQAPAAPDSASPENSGSRSQ